MLRMEIALFLVMAFVAAIYYSAGRRHTPCTGPLLCCWDRC